MYTSLGAMLTALRKARKLSQAQAAQAAQISRVTLTRWETNVQTPRLADLNLLLTALNATPAQKRQALQLLESPEARKHTQALVAQISERKGLPEMPHGGMLLGAMRSRCGWSLEEAAERIGVTSRTLRRWEKGEVWPATDQLHALCYVLGAQEEELTALTVGQFSLTEKPSALTEEDIRAQFQQISLTREFPSEYALAELRYLNLMSSAWLLCGAIRGGAC